MICPICKSKIKTERLNNVLIWCCSKCHISFSDVGLEGKTSKEIQECWNRKVFG